MALLQFTQSNNNYPLILVVEDDKDNLMFMTNALSMFDYCYITAEDAITGMSLAVKHCPSLILLDIRMPQVSGFELLEMLKQNLLTQKIPVVAVTALASMEQKKLMIAAGFNNYLIKPYMLEDLRQIILPYISGTPFHR